MKSLRIPALAAVAGAIALAVLVPRLDPAARFATTLNRDGAIRRAAEVSRKLGVDTTGWSAAAALITDERLYRYRAAHPDDPAARLFTPFSWGVLFRQQGGAATVRVRLFADGSPAAWDSSLPGIAAPAGLPPEFAGNSASLFKPDAAAAEPAWEWKTGDGFTLAARLETSLRNGRLYSVELKPRYARSSETAEARDVMRFVYGVIVFAGFIVALIVFIGGWRAGAFTWRLPAAFAVVCVAWGALLETAGPAYQEYSYNRARVSIPQLDTVERQPGARTSSGMESFGAIAGPLLLLLFGGAGYALKRNRFRGKWTSIELVLRGRTLRRPVCEPLAAGALTGIALAAIPYAIAKFAASPLALPPVKALGARVAEAGLLNFSAMTMGAGFLGLGLPMALRFRARWTRFVVGAIVLGALVLGSGGRFDAAAPALVQGTVGAAICVWLFFEYDVLAVIAALAAAHAVLIPCILLAQPNGAYRDSGVRVLFVLAAAIAVAVNFALRGREVDAVDEAGVADYDAVDTRARSSRERLEAEFQIARKAQQDALPAVPPDNAGFTFDAVCEPAQQVGGDLFDFFPLPDGRLGVAVADVSGKGVPAALYMMVTKGLISAVARESGDLRHILQSINLHLHKACKRKVFVTMAAVAIDPAARRVEYGRAGHNPMVWRRARRGETLLMKPSGVGLGMCSADPFARSLRLEELEMEEGDAIVLYSDGVTEAVNPSMDQFGEDRLMRAIESADGMPATAIRAAIMRDLATFANGAPARDDITVVAIRR